MYFLCYKNVSKEYITIIEDLNLLTVIVNAMPWLHTWQRHGYITGIHQDAAVLAAMELGSALGGNHCKCYAAVVSMFMPQTDKQNSCCGMSSHSASRTFHGRLGNYFFF